MTSQFVKRIAIASAVVLATFGAAAQGTYPDKPVKVVVTTVPGPLDAFARAVLEQMGKRMKATFVVENKAGAGGNLGADIVAKAPADGYTLLFALDTTFTVNPALYRKMPFDVAKDFATIAVPVTYNQMLVVNEKVKANSVADLVKLARGSKMTYASGGNGSPSHLTMAAFLVAAGADMTHIPYKGTGASVLDVVAGQVDALFAVGSGVMPHVKTGKLRALAVSSTQRTPAAPEVPTVVEAGYSGFQASFAYALLAPAGTPDAIVQALAREVEAAMQTPEVRELNRAADYAATGLTQPQAEAWMRDSRKRWAEVIEKAKIVLD
ncbi:MAG: tripartite tricarboxylate transporter substrate binding protein [Rubrivivax sp.]|nr:tripartite tricarboxylate transporter substrate binding protein [Rubrivivax sp.]